MNRPDVSPGHDDLATLRTVALRDEREPVLDVGVAASGKWTSSHPKGEARVRFHATGDEARRLFQCCARVGDPGRDPGLVGFDCRGAIEGVPGRSGQAQVSGWSLTRGTEVVDAERRIAMRPCGELREALRRLA